MTYGRTEGTRTIHQIVGVYDALSAMMADKLHFDWLHVGGFNVSASRLGLPDLGFLTLTENIEATRRIVAATSRPVLVDGDNGYGNHMSVVRLVQEIESTGAAGVHLEDQILPKKCGHMAGKKVVSTEEFLAKIKAFVDTRKSDGFLLFARTDALSVEGLQGAIERGNRYLEAGADVIFVEAPTSIDDARTIANGIPGPLMYNWVFGGLSPLLSLEQLESLGYQYCLQADILFRVSYALEGYFSELKRTGGYGRAAAEMLTFDQFNTLLRLEEFELMDRHYGESQRLDENSGTTN